jgi:hypothetical protein
VIGDDVGLLLEGLARTPVSGPRPAPAHS